MASVLLPEQGALFLHLPKTAGLSISTALERVPGAERMPVRGMRELRGAAAYMSDRLGADAFARLRVFAVVRNPWDWTVSGYVHVTDNQSAYLHRLWRPSFRGFVLGDRWGGRRRGLRRNPNPLKFASPELFVGYHCRLTQWEHLLGPDGAPVPLAQALRFERLAEDVAALEGWLGVRLDMPHRNRSRRAPYARYYDDALREHVARRDAPLIARYGYEFEG